MGIIVAHEIRESKKRKVLTVHNVVIQFDCPKQEDNLEATQEIIDSINEILLRELPDCNPQVFSSGIDRADIIEK
jgi:hypothetical protein